MYIYTYKYVRMYIDTYFYLTFINMLKKHYRSRSLSFPLILITFIIKGKTIFRLRK